ncbi:hypothetical protein ACJZ2D_016832 [Fusarium nematophilum]
MTSISTTISQYTEGAGANAPRSGPAKETAVVDIMSPPRPNPAQSSVEAFAESHRQSYTITSLADIQDDGASICTPALDEADHKQSQPGMGIDFDLLQNWILKSGIVKGFEEESLSADNTSGPRGRTPDQVVHPRPRFLAQVFAESSQVFRGV